MDPLMLRSARRARLEAARPATLGCAMKAATRAIEGSEISNPHKIAVIVCYQTAMIWFIFDLGIGLATFVAWVVAFFREPEAGLRAHSRPWSSSETPPCSFPAGPRGRGNVFPARGADDFAQAIDYTCNYRQNLGEFGAGTKILPDLRERGPPPPSEHAEPEGAGDRVEAGEHSLWKRRRLDHAGVEIVEPAQGVGRAIGRPAPFGVAGFLRRAVAHVKAGLVGARHVLQARDARQAQPLVMLQCLLGVADGAQAGGECRA